MARWFWDNFSSLLLALGLGVVVWIVAVNEENPYEDRAFPEPIAVEITGLPEGMVVVGPVVSEATVTVRAPQTIWAKLSADQIHVAANLEGLSAGSHDVLLQGEVDDRTARVTSIAPGQVRVSLEIASTRTVNIRVVAQGEVALGYQAGEPVVAPARAAVYGPASLVDQVSEVIAPVQLDGLREAFAAEVRLLPVGANGAPISSVAVEPAEAQVNLPVDQLGGYRDVAVKVVLEGQVAFGYRVTNYTVTPPVVTLFSADPEAVIALPGFVETQSLDMEGASDDIDLRTPLALPPGVSLVGEQTVQVQINIAAIESSLTTLEELEAQGLGPGLAASPSPTTVDVILSGPLPVLDTLRPDDVRVVLDLLGLGPGKHQITPQVVIIPQNITYQSVNPGTVEVVIQTATATPAPPP